MKKIYSTLLVLMLMLITNCSQIFAQQLPNPGFEDWSGEKFDGNIQPKDWYVSNISQSAIGMTFNFNLAHQEAGHSGKYSLMVQDTEVGAAGIVEVSPGYFSLGRPWSYIEGLSTGTATAGTSGGINFTYRPDTMSVWIKRTGDSTDIEDFYLLYYAWTGTAKSSSYKNKNGGCTSVSQTNEESDIRLALNGNECGTDEKVTQIAEGMWRERKTYGDWTNIRVPIYYMSDEEPSMMNIIFSASNYPNFRANDSLYEGNSLYVDDVELIYSSKLDELYINERKWNAFDPNSTEEQVYSVGKATEIPAVFGVRGVGSITNARGTTVKFRGRTLTNDENDENDEFQILQQGAIDGDPMIIQVRATDGSSTTTYKIKFVSAASNNARLADIQVNGSNINGFNAYLNTYNVQLPYGTTEVPVVTATAQDAGATVTITQPTSTTGTATIHVAAADGTTTKEYTLHFSVAELSDNTLQAIYIDRELIPGFSPTKNNYTISLPLGTTTTPTITWQSAYADGAQTITLTKNTLDEGAHITVSAPAAQNTRTYKLTYKIEASSYAYLADISLNGQPIDGFSPEQTNYAITLPIGTTTLPAITWTQGDPYQTVTITEGGVDGTTRIVVTAAAGNSVTYRLNFSTEKSTNNALQAIALDGTPLDGFHPDTLNYTLTLPAGTTTLPIVTYTPGDEYQTITLNTSAATRTIRIVVKAGDGSSRVYTLTFEVEKSANALLKMIYLDGDSLVDFTPEQLSYIVSLEQDQIPDITVEQSPDQNVNITQPNSFGTARIMVQPEVGTPIEYTIIFTSSSEPAIPEFATDSFPLSNDVSLAAIYVNGVPLDTLDNPAPQTYTYELPWRTAQVPSVVPVAGALGQTITITSPGLNKTTTIHVVAQDGVTTADYAIYFPVAKSNNTQLESIEIDGVTFDYIPTTREYTITLPYGTKTLPTIAFAKAETEQKVELCTAGLSSPATITVTAEDGTMATYTIAFQVAYAPYDNTLQSLIVDNIGALDLSTGTNHTITLPYGTTDVQFTFMKQYPEQVVTVLNGGVSTPSIITVKADDPTKADKVYTITPNLLTYPEYSLTGVKVDGVALANFDPNVFTYIIPVSQKPEELKYEHAANIEVDTLQDNAKYTQVEVTDLINTRYYTFYYYYQNDTIPNGDFTEYRTGMKNTNHTQMPVGWYGYADQYKDFQKSFWKVDNPGVEIFNHNDTVLGISWGYWAELKSSAPLVLTLGSTEGFSYAVNGGSKATFSGGIPFRNTPDAADITYQLVESDLDSKFSFVFTDEQGNVETTDFTATEVNSGFTTHRQPLATAGKIVDSLNINIDASNGHLAGTDAGCWTKNYCEYGEVIYIDRIAFVYSSALTALTVDSVSATLSGNTFSAALSDSEISMPTLTFTGEVSDQQQVVEWANDWTLSGATATRTATITNYAEDLSSTTYTLTVTRPISNDTTCAYTVEGEDLTIVKASPYQTITVERETTRYVITVQAEDGSTATYYADIQTNTSSSETICETTEAESFKYAPSSATLEGVMIENDILVYETTSPLDTVIVSVTDTAYHLDVFGAAGSNHYCVSRQASNNALLSAILINDAPLTDFYESTFIYQLTAPELPELTATAAEPNALVQKALLRQDDTHYVYFIQVTAPDGYTKQDYTVAINIHKLRSTALLSDIRANTNSIDGFETNKFEYYIALQKGESMPTFKAITADGATAIATTTEQGRLTTITYEVTSEDGTATNTYVVVVEKMQSDVCTLDAIYLDGALLDGFQPSTYDYYVELPYGTTLLPEVTATTTDPAATVTVNTTEWQATIVVTAENNDLKSYTINFTIAKNTDATLSDIFADGALIANFDKETLDYTLELPFGTTLPAITATSTDPNAKVVITAEDEWHYTILVTAEDGITTLTYKVTLVIMSSTNSDLSDIFLDGTPLEDFSPTDYEYTIILPHGAPLPEVTWQVADSQQIVVVEWTEQSVLLTVTAGDEETVSEYTIIFTYELSANNYLLSITLNGDSLATFHRDTLSYTITYPVGTTEEQLLTAEQVKAEPEDTSATVAVQEQGTTLVIIVTAANGKIRAYSIEQVIELSNEARLSMIYLDEQPIEGFDPDTYEYTIKLPQGGILPFVTATPLDTLYGEVELGMEKTLEDGSKLIEVDGIAQDGTRLTYSVFFTFANWSPNSNPVMGDCLFFPVQGTRNTFRAVTISLGVKCAIYSLSGALITIMDVPVLDVNSVEVELNDKGEQVIKEGSVPNDAIGADYVARSGEPFVYMFYNVNTKRIGRGGKYVTH